MEVPSRRYQFSDVLWIWVLLRKYIGPSGKIDRAECHQNNSDELAYSIGRLKSMIDGW